MMGTLAAALAKRKIRTFQDRYKAEVHGEIEDVNGVLKITRIKVQYHLKAPKAQWQEARAALEGYLTGCPAAQSVIGCIDITHDLSLQEMDE